MSNLKTNRRLKLIPTQNRSHVVNPQTPQVQPMANSPAEYPSWSYKSGIKESDVNMFHYDDIKMGTTASQITSLTTVYLTVYSDADQRKHQSSASLVFVRGIHRWPVNSPHKWPVTRKMSPFDDVIMQINIIQEDPEGKYTPEGEGVQNQISLVSKSLNL